ncbi:MAG: SDR family oxidoreductase [Erythrobacter sp.]|jgi:NAD(P)-dependent dehydrogenase (short-subunit alcohol dehydrogenase family)|uniref:SDR family oxidoreductase n=1 Tax=Erythrobacter sp. TaxID=1042 RepID=UPI000C4B83EF|nr:SDR family oxidoreductase [Erythrobacter sp.]MBO6768233.1 SDR family oxidoreductase [Erythrobacter sp.]MBQ94346.1 NAD(P)-dependent oxidoreductase [Actinomycetota bacterium]|tara:strand:+ start:1163 stop:2029 length:867 start_codon:yes stop_codon:yes gene_type:complete
MSDENFEPEINEEPRLPGAESEMDDKPHWRPKYDGSDRLRGKVAIVTGADSGIGRAVAALFAREGADIVIVYYADEETEDADKTKSIVEDEGRRAVCIKGDLGRREFADQVVTKTIAEFGRIDVVVNNAGEQHPDDEVENITEEQLRRTFQTNIFSMFYLVQAARPHLERGAAIVNCTSVTMYKGSDNLLDYSATKGAITAFTRSLSGNLIEDGIRVNAVAPGPIWTPLNPSGGQPRDEMDDFGEDTPMGRPGQPNEVAPSFLFLACEDSSYMSGQVLHPNGGIVVGS